MRILFITWDGPQVSYLEGLFLPIFKRLAEAGVQFHILQFTWGDARRIDTCHKACIEAGFTYQAEVIWRRPVALGSLLTAFRGGHVIRRAIRDHKIDVVMPRSTLPALAALLALRDSAIPMVFDADGLPLDERVDFSGQTPSGLVYRLLRDVEAQAVRRANVVLTRSARAIDILYARAGAGTSAEKFHVVGNGRDTSRFSFGNEESRQLVRARLKIPETSPLLVYAGSIGPQYCLIEMLQLFAKVQLQRPDARFLILTGSPELLPVALQHFSELKPFITVLSVPAHAVPEYLASADLGLALRKRSFSMEGVAPVKLGEYLLCGLPVIATNGIGDSAIIAKNAGFLLDSLEEMTLQVAADWFVGAVLPDRESFRSQCRMLGKDHFSLEASVASYSHALSHIL